MCVLGSVQAFAARLDRTGNPPNMSACSPTPSAPQSHLRASTPHINTLHPPKPACPHTEPQFLSAYAHALLPAVLRSEAFPPQQPSGRRGGGGGEEQSEPLLSVLAAGLGCSPEQLLHAGFGLVRSYSY